MPEHSHTEDIQLMARIKARKQDALDELYQKYKVRTYTMAYQVTQHKQLAEDVMQDVFFQIWRWPERWDPDKGRFLSWLLTVTRYTAIDYIRREKNQPLPQIPSEMLVQPSINGYGRHEPSVDDQGQKIRQHLKKLPKEQRTAILLAFFRGMTHEEIADQLNLPLGTVKSRIRLGMQKLKAYVIEDEKLHN